MSDLLDGTFADVEIWVADFHRVDLGWVTFDPASSTGRVPCAECGGTGWWGFGPKPSANGPCVVCKGAGRQWVGLW